MDAMQWTFFINQNYGHAGRIELEIDQKLRLGRYVVGEHEQPVCPIHQHSETGH